MNVEVEKLEHNMAKLTITVDSARFEEAITQAYKKMKNQISIPGFRKGKVPQVMVEKMYGPGIFYEDAANIVIPEAYDEAMIQLKDLPITSQPEIDVSQMNKGEDFIFTAEVALKPEVTLGQYTGIEVEEIPVEVTEDEVDNKIAQTQEQNSREISVDRPAASGDIVIIDFDGSIDGESFEGGSASDYSLELGSGTFIPGFEDQLTGVSGGSDVEVNVTFPEDYSQADVAGKDAVFKVKVKDVRTKELPELDDDFAQDVSECDTFEEYREQVRQEIIEEKKDEGLQEKQNRLMETIVGNCEMDIPDAMVNTQASQMLEQYSQQMRYSGLTMEQYYRYTNTNEEMLLEELKPQALSNIQRRLVLEAVAKAEGLEATDEELEEEYEKMAKDYNMDVESVKEYFGDDQADMIRSDISADKALKFITDNSVEIPAAAADEETGEESSPEEEAKEPEEGVPDTEDADTSDDTAADKE